MDFNFMLTALVLIPLLAAFLIGFLRLPARPTALVAGALNLILGCIVFYLQPTGEAVLQAGNYLFLSMNFGVQQIMVFLTLMVTFAALLSTKAPDEGKALWYNSTLIISAGALGAFLSDSLLGFFAFHELALIPTFLMIGLYGRGEKRAAAWRITLYLSAGSLVLLAGLLMLMGATGCKSFSTLAASQTTLEFMSLRGYNPALISGLLLLGLGTLVSLFPFHSWAAPAYASAPSPVAMMHAGVLKKFGLYGLLMFFSVLPAGFFAPWNTILLVLLVGNVLWVGWVTMNQKRLDLTLGNSSVMHMGYIFLGFAALVASGSLEANPMAYKGAVMLMVGHGLTIALLFMLCGAIERSTGTLEYKSLGGLAVAMPKLAFLFGLGAMASIGLPGFANFPGEFLVFFSGFQAWQGAAEGACWSMGPVQIATICCLWGLVISAVYMLRAFKNVFQGEPSRQTIAPLSLEGGVKLAAALLALALIVIGLMPNVIFNVLQ